jgi:hypothetical protein
LWKQEINMMAQTSKCVAVREGEVASEGDKVRQEH